MYTAEIGVLVGLHIQVDDLHLNQKHSDNVVVTHREQYTAFNVATREREKDRCCATNTPYPHSCRLSKLQNKTVLLESIKSKKKQWCNNNIDLSKSNCNNSLEVVVVVRSC